MEDHFPERMTIQFGNQILVYRKKGWKIPDEKTGELIEKGLRYGENPGQEAALYELVHGNLALGGCEFIEPGKGLVSAISEEEMLDAIGFGHEHIRTIIQMQQRLYEKMGIKKQ